MSETFMWLMTVAIAPVLGLVISVRTGLRWTWGLAIQQLLIFIIAAVGIYFSLAPHPVLSAQAASNYAKYCAWAAWALFFVFNICQRLLLNKLALDLSLLKVREAKKRVKWVRTLVWGPPGEYWAAIVKALELYQEERSEAADALIDEWQHDSRIPMSAKEALLGFAMLGRVLHNDWNEITTRFEESRSALQRAGTFVPMQIAARAYAEEGRFIESLSCVAALLQQNSRPSGTTVDIHFVPFFALSGAERQLKGLFDDCKDMKALPDYSRLFWLGRCYAVRGETARSIQTLAQSKEATPADLKTWHTRVDAQIHQQQLIAAGYQPQTAFPAPENVIDQAVRLYRRWRVTAEVVRPGAAGPVLVFLMWALVAAYLVEAMPTSFHQFGVPFANMQEVINWGALDEHLWKGEWWRLITYMFLHGNLAHLLLNTGALYLFGKTVDRLYGSFKFCIIFLLTGILSGLVQLAALPTEPAVGASGAILGIFGAGMAGMIKLKNVLPPQIRKAELRWMLSIAILQAIFDQAVNNIAAATEKGPGGIRIAAFAHVGGIVAGLLIGLLLPLSRKTVDIGEPSG